MNKTMAPWTVDQVVALNNYQRAGHMHPFACPYRTNGKHQSHRETGGDLGALQAQATGWVCLDCEYTQDWAHEFMLTAQTHRWLLARSGTSLHLVAPRVPGEFPRSACGISNLSNVRTERRLQAGKPASKCRKCELRQ